MLDIGKKPAEPKRLSVWAVTKHACFGVPITVRWLDRPWKEVLTHRFPLFFSILPWVGFIVLCSITEPWDIEAVSVPKDEFFLVRIIGFIDAVPYGIIAFTVLYSWVPFLVNILLLGWCLIILVVFKASTKKIFRLSKELKE